MKVCFYELCLHKYQYNIGWNIYRNYHFSFHHRYNCRNNISSHSSCCLGSNWFDCGICALDEKYQKTKLVSTMLLDITNKHWCIVYLCDNKRKDLWFRPLTIFSRKAQETKKSFFDIFLRLMWCLYKNTLCNKNKLKHIENFYVEFFNCSFNVYKI